MTEFTPIPGVWYHPKGLSVTRNGAEEPLLLCYSPMREGDRVPFTDADLVDRWAWPEDREAVVIFNPHPMRSWTEWAVRRQEKDGTWAYAHSDSSDEDQARRIYEITGGRKGMYSLWKYTSTRISYRPVETDWEEVPE